MRSPAGTLSVAAVDAENCPEGTTSVIAVVLGSPPVAGARRIVIVTFTFGEN